METSSDHCSYVTVSSNNGHAIECDEVCCVKKVTGFGRKSAVGSPHPAITIAMSSITIICLEPSKIRNALE